MKEVLVVYYSQTGQLADIINTLVSTVNGPGIRVTYHRIVPKNPFKFPWKDEDFMGAFPDSYLQVPHEILPPSNDVLSKKYDLVILGHQVWYLSPSIPLNSFLKSKAAKKLLNGVPVITVIGARNMWYQSQEKLKKLLVDCKAKLVGNIVLTDRNINHISVITIEYWMMTGKKDRKWGLLPKPGISEKDIREVVRFGPSIKEALLQNNFEKLQNKLLALGAVNVKMSLVMTGQRGNFVFSKWAAMVVNKSKESDAAKKRWLGYFKRYLQFAIWIIAPVVFIVFLLTYIPLYKKFRRDKEYYSSVAIKDA